MAEPAVASKPASRPLPRGDSRKIFDDDGRRNRFKGRGKDLERGISAPSLQVDKVGEGIIAGRMAPLPLNENEVITVGEGLGHAFSKKTFFQLTHCQYCSEVLWGLKSQGYMCKICNYVSHEKCIPFLKTPCRHIMADAIQDPVAHVWTTRPVHLKKKRFCNICRKKISSEAFICEVCKFYSHTSCKNNTFNNCKQCATYSQSPSSSDTHHWIEGNLPSSSRCQVCTKNCYSSDCLTGFRCGWCGIAVHSKCLETHEQQNRKCSFRDLWGMILVPRAVCHRNIIHSDQDSVTPISGDVTSPVISDDETGADDIDGGGDGGKGKPCIVIDGSGKQGFKKWRKTTMHPLYLTKTTTAKEILVISLRKCGISDDPADYYLTEMVDTQQERELHLDENPYYIQSKGHGVLRLYLRHESAHKCSSTEVKGRMTISNGHLGTSAQQITVTVSNTSTAAEIVKEAMTLFGMNEESSMDYCLVEVSQVVGVKERVLSDTDCPWNHYQDLRRDSLTLSNRQRYYIRSREGDQTSIFLTITDKDLLSDKEKCNEYIKQLISEGNQTLLSFYDKIEVGPAFPSMGGLILTFPTFELAMKLTLAMEDSSCRPKIVILPSINPDSTGIDQEPMLVFINGKSGGNQGVELISAFRRHLNPHQVWDLCQSGPIPGLWSMRCLKQFRILIGGGDGTFGWVLGALQEVKECLTCKEPPSALLPLGTGNDLARAMNWGGGYTGEKVMNILLKMEDTNIIHLDRWTVTFKNTSKQEKDEKAADSEHGPVVMNNYMGIGLDAAIALDFHLAREENPEKFSSRLHNKGFYLQLGLQKMVHRSETRELNRHVTLTVDGKEIKLPDIAGLIVLNIQSWGAGADPWGSTNDPAYKPATYDDGLLEVVGIKGVLQMGQVQSGIKNAVRIAQGSEFSVELLSPLPVQVDGEAWGQPPSTISIKKLPDSAAILKGPDKASYSRSLSKKEKKSSISLLHTVSSSGIEFSEGLSYRRTTVPTNLPEEQ